VTISLSALHIRAVILDIEGTTTPIDFVYTVLFPYARAHLAAFLAREWESPACREAVALLESERAADAHAGSAIPALPASPAPVVNYVGRLMDEDRKSRGLKMLQGLIWEHGYRDGDLHGQVYPDVPPSLERWTARRLLVCIYSSGSVLAQRLIFRSTPEGDLTRFLSGYFDTGVGPKASVGSYAQIAQALGAAPGDVLFVSDVAAELDAASAAGLRTALCVRPGAPEAVAATHPIVHDFHEILD
jgi:enolase-phosphatase E1